MTKRLRPEIVEIKREKLHYRYEESSTFLENLMNFGPQTAEITLLIFTHPVRLLLDVALLLRFATFKISIWGKLFTQYSVT